MLKWATNTFYKLSILFKNNVLTAPEGLVQMQ